MSDEYFKYTPITDTNKPWRYLLNLDRFKEFIPITTDLEGVRTTTVRFSRDFRLTENLDEIGEDAESIVQKLKDEIVYNDFEALHSIHEQRQGSLSEGRVVGWICYFIRGRRKINV